MGDKPIEFGYIDKKRNFLVLCEFCNDPDGSGLIWTKETGETRPFNADQAIKKAKAEYTGVCYDTASYFSHVGELLKQLIASAPEGAKLMVFTYETGSGTKTFHEEVEVIYY